MVIVNEAIIVFIFASLFCEWVLLMADKSARVLQLTLALKILLSRAKSE
jgi:hypothetical protein